MRRILSTFHVLLVLAVGAQAQVNYDSVQVPGVLMVSEIMFNPEPGGADYVELRNVTDAHVPLAGVCLARFRNGAIDKLFPLDDNYSVAPGEYVVVTTDVAYLRSHYTVEHLDRVIEVTNMPPYNDASGTVIVALEDTSIMDRLDYTETMHSRLLSNREGVALERRSFDRPTQEANNWTSASGTSGYGTPTSPNSQSVEILFTADDFVLSNTIFSPDGDGYNDLLDISYSLTHEDLSANISICDASGRVVRHLSRNAVLGTSGVVTWDGLDDSGSRCLPARYIVLIDAYSREGRHQALRQTVVLQLR